MRTITPVFLLPVLMTAFQLNAQAQLITVGTHCDYANLQLAVNASSDGDTIRVEGKTFTGTDATVNISGGKAIAIFGGYDDYCTNPTINPTTMDATGEGDSVFELYGSSGSTGNFDHVTIRNFIITGGENDANYGGGIEIDAGYHLYIESSEISNNSSTFGGGIHIMGDAKVTISGNTMIKGNTATDSGGGVYCDAAHVVLTNGASLGDFVINPIGNTAANAGGGFYGKNGCRFDVDAEVKGNSAPDGGGVYLTGASSLYLLFPESAITSNRATNGGGGGVYLSGGATMTQSNGRISYNTAEYNGGGIYATGANTQVDLNANTAHCSEIPKCVEVSHNTADASNGGGLYLGNGAGGEVAQTYFEYNTGYFGGAIYVRRENGTQTTLTIKNTVFGRNTAKNRYILRYNSADAVNVALSLEGLTFAENIDDSDSITEIGLRGEYTASMRGLIIWGDDSQDAYFVESGATASIDDSLLPAGGTFPPGNLVGYDPLFIDSANDDFHIRPNSPAVNLYYGGSLVDDIDGDIRPSAGPTYPGFGPMLKDAGADEVTTEPVGKKFYVVPAANGKAVIFCL